MHEDPGRFDLLPPRLAALLVMRARVPAERLCQRGALVARLLRPVAGGFLILALLAGAACGSSSGTGGSSGSGAATAPPAAAKPQPPVALTVQFASDVSDPAALLVVPVGWSVEGDRPGRKFSLRAGPATAANPALIEIRPGAPGYPAGLWLRLESLPSGAANELPRATVLQGGGNNRPGGPTGIGQ